MIELRKTLGRPLDGLRVVINETASRWRLHRWLECHRLSRPPVEPKEGTHQPFQAYRPGFAHLDVTSLRVSRSNKYLPPIGGEGRRDLFVAIDRETRWVSVDVFPEKTAANAKRFPAKLAKAEPFRIHTIFTDHSKESTDRFITRGERAPTGRHAFDARCTALDIEHRPTQPRRPQTNGMVERVNGRIAEILATHHFNRTEDLEATLRCFVWLYNTSLRRPWGKFHRSRA